MNIAFRVDASLKIGSGHVMRCLTLADALRSAGAQCHFICRDHTGNMAGLIASRGFKVSLLPASGGDTSTCRLEAETRHAVWLRTDWMSDAEQARGCLGSIPVDWLIVDHYAIDARWEQEMRPLCRRLMVIDDLADRQHDCDLLLDQNLYEAMETRYDKMVPAGCKKLLGPTYALLRPEFSIARKGLRHRTGQVSRVLVSFGGADPTNETEKTLLALAGIGEGRIEVDVVVGGGNPHKERIEEFCSSREGFRCHCMVDNMAELMAAADVAIGAGGATTWERCAVGLPSLVTVLAENQLALVEHAARQGLLFYLGQAQAVTPKMIQDSLEVFALSPQSLQSYSTRGLATVDAEGVQRVVRTLCPPRISIRRAVAEDCDAVYAWRNAEETRRYIFDDRTIPLETHREWFRNTLDNPARVLLIGEIDGKPVGVLRYDLACCEALISVYLVPGGQGRGIGSQFIRSGSLWLKEHLPVIKTINAKIFKENVASLRAFEAAGYVEHHAIYKETL